MGEEPVPLVVLEQDMQEPLLVPFAGTTAAVWTSRKPGRDTPNEDAIALFPYGEGSGVALVADGAGGQPEGGHAAALAIREMQRAVSEAAGTGTSLREAIIDGFERANRAVLALGVGAATTLAAVEVGPGLIRTYHAGDSQVLVTGQRGRVKLFTLSHSPVGYAVEAGLVDGRAALHHEDRHVVSNMIGSVDMHIQVGSSLRLGRRDTVVVGSDGLFDNLHGHEIVHKVRSGRLGKAAALLAAQAKERMVNASDGQPSKPDDLSFIVLRPV